MRNMSYCRFENTVEEIKELLDVLDENEWDLKAMMKNATKHEAKAMREFVELCRLVADSFHDSYRLEPQDTFL